MSELFKLRFAPANDRGFLRADFKDYNGEDCSIQASSIAARVCQGEIDQQQCIWLGQNEGTHHMGRCMARMHLTREMAKELAFVLMRFHRHGSLAEPTPEDQLANIQHGLEDVGDGICSCGHGASKHTRCSVSGCECAEFNGEFVAPV